MASSRLKVERIATGIDGLDGSIGGGLVKGDVHIITGGPGTWKTMFAANMAYNVAKKGEVKVVYAAFEESREYFKRNMKLAGLDFELLEQAGKIKIMDLEALAGKELEANVQLLLTAVDESDSKLLVIDSLTALLLACQTKLEIRMFVKMIYNALKQRGVTGILTVSLTGEGRLGAEGFICDSVILLENVIEEFQQKTRLLIVKMRATEHSRKYHSVVFRPYLSVSKY